MKEISGKAFLFSIFKGHTAIIACKNEKHYKKHTYNQNKAYLYSFLHAPNIASFSHINKKTP